MAFELKSIDPKFSEIHVLRAMMKIPPLVRDMANALDDAAAERAVQEHMQLIRNTLQGIGGAAVPDAPGSSPSAATGTAPAQQNTAGVDPTPIFREVVDTVQMMASQFTMATLQEYMANHADFNSAFNMALEKSYGDGLLFMRQHVGDIAMAYM